MGQNLKDFSPDSLMLFEKIPDTEGITNNLRHELGWGEDIQRYLDARSPLLDSGLIEIINYPLVRAI